MKAKSEMEVFVNSIPAISTHEHIGSFMSKATFDPSMGHKPDVLPGQAFMDIGLLEVLTGPYMRHLLIAHGYKEDNTQDRLAWWKQVRPCLWKTRGTGLFRSLEKGFLEIHGIHLTDLMQAGDAEFLKADEKVMAAYQKGLFAYTEEIFQKANVERSIKLVQETYFKALEDGILGEQYEIEKALHVPVLRIDSLFDIVYRTDRMEKALGYRVDTFLQLEQMIKDIFAMCDRLKVPAIKQFQGYTRSLAFEDYSPEEAAAAMEGDWRSRRESQLIVQDYVMKRVTEEANTRGMAYQFHSGMSNHPGANPMSLANLVGRYPNVKFVFLHCYPYFAEAAYLAFVHPNVYLDASWMAMLGAGVLRKALTEWIGYVPYEKIFLSSDACNLESFYGAYEIHREVLVQVLEAKIASGEITREEAKDYALHMLRENAKRIYLL